MEINREKEKRRQPQYSLSYIRNQTTETKFALKQPKTKTNQEKSTIVNMMHGPKHNHKRPKFHHDH